MNTEEYEDRMRQLGADAETARQAYIRAKAHYERICSEMQNLRITWREEQEQQR